jgi:SAM-dependent methyltransferase
MPKVLGFGQSAVYPTGLPSRQVESVAGYGKLPGRYDKPKRKHKTMTKHPAGCRVSCGPTIILLLGTFFVIAPLEGSAWEGLPADGQEKPGQSRTKPRYEFREQHDPDGIGKFYMGREIAKVMGHLAIDWLERPEREREEAPTKLMKALPLKPGMVLADVGAGSGFFTFRLAKEVGPQGRILAVDIQQEMLDYLSKKAKELKMVQVEPILGTETDPRLPAEKVDLILMVDVYHEFSHPYEMTENMVKALKVGGKLIFVEYRAEDDWVPIKPLHKMTERQVLLEMQPFPLKHKGTNPALPWQHIIIFEKTAK